MRQIDKVPVDAMEANRLKRIYKVQGDVMEALRGCKLQPYEVMSVMLNIAMSIARETEPKPIRAITDRLEEIQSLQDSDCI